jgi:hypothetical protein
MSRHYEDMPPEEWIRRSVPDTITGNELRDKEFPPITWVVPGILPAGVTLFGGREKMGKSWMAFGLAIAVATGGVALGTKRVEQGRALYLSLEDSERRLHRRINKLASDAADLSLLHCRNKWLPADRGGIEDLDAWLEAHPDTRLVVIDTLKRIRPYTSGRRNMYDDDYDAVQPFVPLADRHDVALILIHHLNQQSNPDDPYDWFSGSAGLVAAAEGILLFRRRRGEADGYLTVDGKDVEEKAELALQWDALAATWTVIGDADSHRLNKERREIVELLEREDEPMGPKAVAELLGKGYDATKQMMKRMSDDGQLKQEGYGKYLPLIGHSSHSSHSSTNGSGVTGVTGVTTPRARSEESVTGVTGVTLPLSADEGNGAHTVAELFANPPDWLTKQLKVYRQNPDQNFKPLCVAVAAALDEGSQLRPEEVAEEVRLALQPRTTVVNRHSGASYDVNIQRGPGGTVPKTGRGMWGNPFEVGEDKDGTLDEVLEKFRRYILEGGVEKYDGTIWDGRHLLEHLHEIRGKRLGCTCKPKDCHGDDLARLADQGSVIDARATGLRVISGRPGGFNGVVWSEEMDRPARDE